MIRDARAAVVDPETEDAREQDDALTNFSLWVDFDDTGIDLPALVETGDSVVLHGGGAVYRAYTTRYDRELRPAAQIRAALLREYRDRLDAQVAAQRINVTRLARVLRASGDDAGAREHLAESDRLRRESAAEHEARVWTSLGSTRLDGGDAMAALDAFRRALAIRATYAPAYFQMGRALERLGDAESAAGAYARARQLNPRLVRGARIEPGRMP